jgi:hypothetical protein
MMLKLCTPEIKVETIPEVVGMAENHSYSIMIARL